MALQEFYIGSAGPFYYDEAALPEPVAGVVEREAIFDPTATAHLLPPTSIVSSYSVGSDCSVSKTISVIKADNPFLGKS